MYKGRMYRRSTIKKTLTVTTVLLAALSSTLCAEKTHLDIKVPNIVEGDLFGPVKAVETDNCFNMSNKHTKEKREYDTSGNLLVETDWNRDGELDSTTTNYYDENGCYTGQYYIDHDEGETNNWEVILNPATRQIAKRDKKTGATILRTYSPEKYLVHFKQLDKEKKLIKASRTKRREDNRESEYVKLDNKNRPLYTYYFMWDDRGFIEKERVRYHQEKKERLHTYDYLKVDGHGNWTQRLMIRYDVGGKDKTKMYEKLTVRTIEYFEDNPVENEP